MTAAAAAAAKALRELRNLHTLAHGAQCLYRSIGAYWRMHERTVYV